MFSSFPPTNWITAMFHIFTCLIYSCRKLKRNVVIWSCQHPLDWHYFVKRPVFFSQESNTLHFIQHLPHPPQHPDISWHFALNIYQSLCYNTTDWCSSLISCKTPIAIFKDANDEKLEALQNENESWPLPVWTAHAWMEFSAHSAKLFKPVQLW